MRPPRGWRRGRGSGAGRHGGGGGGGAPGRLGGTPHLGGGEPAPHGADVPAGRVEARVQHHPAALAQHVHGAAEGHDEVLQPLAAAAAECRGRACELGEREDVVARGEAGLGQHLTVLAVDGVHGLRSRGPQECGELGSERWWIGWWIGWHRLGRVVVAGSGEHPRSIPWRHGATDVHPLGGPPLGRPATSRHLRGARPSDGRPITHRARTGPRNRIGITLRTPIG
jgi:hypothetical protein